MSNIIKPGPATPGARRLRRICIAALWVAIVALVISLGVLLDAKLASAATTTPAAALAPTVRVPDTAAMYRRFVEQAATEVWGVEASPARLAAQLHQESSWKMRARSPVGAQGLAQFMPGTAKWIAGAFPEKLGKFDPWDPRQAALAAAIYDDFLLKRIKPKGVGELSLCSQWAFTLRAYNGGEKYLLRDRDKADKAGANANDWRHVERFRTRGAAAHRENIGYPKRILLVLEPAYIAAGWGGSPTCELNA